jgi:hypothetical protein
MAIVSPAATFNSPLYNEVVYNAAAIAAVITVPDSAAFRISLGARPQTFEAIFARAASRGHAKQVE